jgi:predicted RNA-binding Zn-ribbon protein involved in translation (DUF1610 family)
MKWPFTTRRPARTDSRNEDFETVDGDVPVDREFYEHRCPECGSREIARDFRERFLDRLLWLRLGLPAYLCADCDCRFLDRPIPSFGAHRLHASPP